MTDHLITIDGKSCTVCRSFAVAKDVAESYKKILQTEQIKIWKLVKEVEI